jgi:hypothetical protein
MPKNKRLPDELLAKLHGKGTMSEILDIERARLLKQSEQDMRRQLSQLESRGSAGQPPDSGIVAAPPLPSLVPADVSVSREPEREQTTPLTTGAGMENITSTYHRSTPIPVNANNYRTETVEIDTYQPAAAGDIFPQRLTSTPLRGVEGFSALSRVVGDDLSELGTIFRHSIETVAAPPRFLPEAAQAYYTERIEPALPFTAQRNLLGAIRRLTLGWGTLSCQITLELLSNVSGIRNFKTLRKWLADLNRRNLIRYTPVHGDLRGSVVTLTPPSDIRAEIERCWHEGTSQTNRAASHSETG